MAPKVSTVGRMSNEIEQRTVGTADIEFGVLESGPRSGPLALCLHGFPDTAWTWRHLMPELAGAGYHVVAPFMRGYLPTSIPADGCYQTGALAADALALHEALGGGEEAVLIGHDWGAAAAYGAAAFAPDRWRRVVTSAVPPLPALLSGFFSFRQLKRSFYIFVFQTPLAEIALTQDEMSFIDGLWADWSPGYDATFDLVELKKALATPENRAAAVGYYRAMLDPSLHSDRYAAEQAAALAPTPQPTLYIHGTEDGALGAELVDEGVLAYLGPRSRLELIDRAGHFSHLDRPELVGSLILDFLAEV